MQNKQHSLRLFEPKIAPMNCIFPADSKNIIIFEKEAILKKEGEGV
jgi:hypothetical protein